MTEIQVPVGSFKCDSCDSVDEVVAKLPQFRWKVQDAEDGGKMAFAVISGNKATGEIHVLAALEDAAAPRHEHLEGGPYGELILGIAGQLWDEADDGQSVFLNSGDILIHGGGTIHAPRPAQRSMRNRFWFGYYHQPRGFRLIAP